MLLVSQTQKSLIQDLSTVLWLFSCLGFMVSTAKTTVAPSTAGFNLNTKTMTVALPTAKIRGIQLDMSKIQQNKTIALKTLSQLLGKLVATKPAVLVAPLYYCTL